MCGRTACTLDHDQTRRACAYTNRQGRFVKPRWYDPTSGSSSGNPGNHNSHSQQGKVRRKYYPSFNVAPTAVTPVLVSAKHFDKEASSADRLLTPMQWGLVPSWHKGSDPTALAYKMNNCRREGMMEKASFRRPAERGQRCVVVVDGYYEWLTSNDGKKQPYFIYFSQDSTPAESVAPAPTPPKTDQPEPADLLPEEEVKEQWKGRRLLTLAGLFDRWCSPGGGEVLYTYAVITLAATAGMNWLHHRVPAILDGDEAVRDWLDYGAVPTVKAMSLIKAETTLASHPVSTRVNNSRYKDPDCVLPVDIKKAAIQTASSKLMSAWLTKGAKPSASTDEIECRSEMKSAVKSEEVKMEVRPDIKKEPGRVRQEVMPSVPKEGSSPWKQTPGSSPRKRTAMTAWLCTVNPSMQLELPKHVHSSPSKKKAKML